MTNNRINFSVPKLKLGKKTIISGILALVFTVEANSARLDGCGNEGLIGLLKPIEAVTHTLRSIHWRYNGIMSMCGGNEIPILRHFE